MIRDSEFPVVTEVAPGFFVRIAVDNCGWVDMGEYTIMMGGLEEHDLADEVIGLVRETMPREDVKYMLNTHTHYDHVALNEAFVKRCGAEIVNADVTDIAAGGLRFEGKERSCVVYHVPGCHTSTDCLFHFPEDGVLFVGDLFGWGLIPWDGNLREEKRRLILDRYEMMIGLDADVVVAGHGPLLSTAELVRWRGYFTTMMSAAIDGFSRNLSAQEVRGLLTLPVDMEGWWRFRDWKHEDTVKKIVKAASKGFIS